MHVDQQRAQWTGLCENLTQSIEEAGANATCDLNGRFELKLSIHSGEQPTAILERKLKGRAKWLDDSLTFEHDAGPAGV